MNALMKSMDRSNALVNTAHAVALSEKARGGGIISQRMVSPTMMSAPSDWQQQSRNRENYLYFRSWVYAAVNALASEAGGQPVRVGRLKGADVTEKEGRRLSRTKAYQLDGMTKNVRTKAADKEVEVMPDHELVDILEHPNPIQWKFQFVYSFVANLCLTGRAYVVKDQEDGRDQYYCLPTTWVKPDHEKGPYSRFYVSNPRDLDFVNRTEPLDVSQVAMAVLPNPADPMSALSPASSQSAAIRVDDRIQVCQEKFFDNAPFPSVIVTIGKDPHPDVPGGIRPRLTGTQRRQVMGAIRKVMGGVANYGNPAIVDGLIENITKFGQTQPEIGWDKSEDKLKNRILSAFCVHPFILGDTSSSVGSYAQSYVIHDRFCSRINIFLDLLSILMTGFCQPKEEEEKKAAKLAGKGKLLVWWEKTKANDPSMDWTNRRASRAAGDVSKNEMRSWLGLPPDEEGNEAMITPAQATAIIQMMPLVGQSMQPDQAKALMTGLGIPDDLAERIAGQGMPQQDPLAMATDQLGAAIASIRVRPKMLAHDILAEMGG